MFLLSSYILRLQKFCVNTAAFFRIIPYKWDNPKDQLIFVLPSTSKFSFLHWNAVKYFLVLHQIFLFTRFGQSLVDESINFTQCVAQAAYLTAYLIGTMLQIFLIHRFTMVLALVNRFLGFFKQVEGNCSDLCLLT